MLKISDIPDEVVFLAGHTYYSVKDAEKGLQMCSTTYPKCELHILDMEDGTYRLHSSDPLFDLYIEVENAKSFLQDLQDDLSDFDQEICDLKRDREACSSQIPIGEDEIKTLQDDLFAFDQDIRELTLERKACLLQIPVWEDKIKTLQDEIQKKRGNNVN